MLISVEINCPDIPSEFTDRQIDINEWPWTRCTFPSPVQFANCLRDISKYGSVEVRNVNIIEDED